MPLGAARLNTLSRVLSTTVAGDPRTNSSLAIQPINDTKISTSQNKFGGASIELDGNDDAIFIPKVPHWDGSGDMTFEAFVQTKDRNAGQAIFTFRGLDSSFGGSGTYNASDSKTIIIMMDYGGDFQVYLDGAFRQDGTGEPQFSNNTWHHVAVQRKDGVWNGWVDGTRYVNYSSGTDFTATLRDFEQPIGFRGFSSPSDDWNGYMDEIRISDSARYNTGSSITVPTQAFTPDANTILLVHGDGTNNDTLITDDPSAVLKGFDVGSRRTHHQDITTKPGSNSATFTLAYWFKFDSTSTNEIIFNYQSGTSNTSFPGGTKLLFAEVFKGRFRTGSLGDWDFSITDTGANPESAFGNGWWDGEWHHFLMSIDGSNNLQLYVDGVNETSNAFGTLPGSGDTVYWSNFQKANVSTAWNDAHSNLGNICQLYIDNTYNNIADASVRKKFYNNGAVDMGTDGTGSGLSQPLVYHHGDATEFHTNRGTGFVYGSTESGTADGTTNGPTLGKRSQSTWNNGGFSVTSSGVFNNALQLSAGGSAGNIAFPSDFEFDDNVACTVEFRFKISDGGTSGKTTKLFSTTGISNDSFPTSSNHLTLHTYSDGNLYFTHDGNENNLGNPGTGFHHIAMQYDGTGSFRLWLDGTHKFEATHSITTAVELYFGNRRAGEGSNSGTNTIDEIRVSSTTRYTHSSSNITVPTEAFTNDDNTVALFHCESTTQTDDNS